MKKQLWVLPLLLCVCLCACGGPSPASEAKLQEDLESSEIFARQVGYLGGEVTHFDVLKRKTDRENRVDTVWVQVDGESDAVASSTYYVMNYSLYNDGWLLDDISADATDLWEYVPKRKPSEETVRSVILDNSIILDEVLELGDGRYAVKYQSGDSFTYCDVDYQYAVNFNFQNGYGGGIWVADVPYELERFEHWKLDGAWRMKNNNGPTFEVTLAGFDPQTSDTVIGSIHELYSGKTFIYDEGTYHVYDDSERYNYMRYRIETGAYFESMFSRKQYLIYVTYNSLQVGVFDGATWAGQVERISN